MKLDQYRLIEISGIDAEKYLQGQLTCDVAKLEIGCQTLTSHCDPKGKMSALLRLYRHAPTQFFAIIRAELLPEALVQLKKYAVFSKVEFTELNHDLYGITQSDALVKFGDEVTACQLADRTLFWGDIQPETNAEASVWDLLDIQQGVPILHKENQFELIPQAVNLQMIEQAISFTKGCYIGQETVARAKYRGANKRAMFTFVAEITANELPEIASAIEMQIEENWKSTGLILSRVISGNQLWLQVVLNKEIAPHTHFRVGDIPLQLYPLPYSLDENE